MKSCCFTNRAGVVRETDLGLDPTPVNGVASVSGSAWRAGMAQKSWGAVRVMEGKALIKSLSQEEAFRRDFVPFQSSLSLSSVPWNRWITGFSRVRPSIMWMEPLGTNQQAVS